jgi:hypothetical protein
MLSRIDYHGWNAVRLASPKLELIAPLDIGPRIISLRVPGSRNLFAETKDQLGGRDEKEYRIRGGHRLWHAPEDIVRTYQLDNSAVALAELPKGRGFELTQPVETGTGIEKAIRVELVAPHTVRLTHTITNRGTWPVETAVWCLSVLRAGGFSVIPLPPKGQHPRDLLPEFSLVPWTYTDLSLPAWRFFPSFIRVETRKVPAPQKLGITNYPGWAGYWMNGDFFVKHAAVRAGATYPDRGCPFETYADPNVTELETLSPFGPLLPGRKITHVETWALLSGVPKPASEAIYRAEILPAVQRWLSSL